jgi:hypothetical protein
MCEKAVGPVESDLIRLHGESASLAAIRAARLTDILGRHGEEEIAWEAVSAMVAEAFETAGRLPRGLAGVHSAAHQMASGEAIEAAKRARAEARAQAVAAVHDTAATLEANCNGAHMRAAVGFLVELAEIAYPV